MNKLDSTANSERASQVARPDPLTPADRYQELFVAVQTNRVFDDSKTFVDCAPRGDPTKILQAYHAQANAPAFDLRAFVQQHFAPPRVHHSHYVSTPDQALHTHIDGLWDVLTRHPREHPAHASILALPYPYVVPGGRFGELYYWDSYFTMLGLAESGRSDLLHAMANNFAYLIDAYGHIPNGNRSYYLSRSQPPVFALMVELFEKHGVCEALEYLPRLHKEYAYWMDGADDLRPGDAHRHCVRLEDGSVLNRYWDDRDTPREESYLEDVTTAKQSSRPAHAVYRELRAGAASGWDFSARWCDDPDSLASIRTTSIVPVDLNSFLYKLECQIGLLNRACGEQSQADAFEQHARERRAAMDCTLWNDAAGAYLDYDWERAMPREALNAASATPLFVHAASRNQARRTSQALRKRLLDDGGIGTSEFISGQQWDKPNGWAPLQWLAIEGLRHYGDPLAEEIEHRWLGTVGNLFKRESKLVEKYVLVQPKDVAVGGHGGEYPLQDGFGWTNGVTRRLLGDNPAHHAHQARAANAR